MMIRMVKFTKNDDITQDSRKKSRFSGFHDSLCFLQLGEPVERSFNGSRAEEHARQGGFLIIGELFEQICGGEVKELPFFKQDAA